MISFYNEDVQGPNIKKNQVKSWILKICENHKKEAGDIAFIFCSDDYLLKINQKYLQHDDLTDIITFDYSEDSKISGDIFISVERVHENALSFGATFSQELMRVLAHGVLHLIGFKDKNPQDQKLMRAKEEEALQLAAL